MRRGLRYNNLYLTYNAWSVGYERPLGRCLLRLSVSLCWRSLHCSLALCEKQTHASSNYFLKSPVTVATRPTCVVCHGGRPTQTFKLFKASSHVMALMVLTNARSNISTNVLHIGAVYITFDSSIRTRRRQMTVLNVKSWSARAFNQNSVPTCLHYV